MHKLRDGNVPDKYCIFELRELPLGAVCRRHGRDELHRLPRRFVRWERWSGCMLFVSVRLLQRGRSLELLHLCSRLLL